MIVANQSLIGFTDMKRILNMKRNTYSLFVRYTIVCFFQTLYIGNKIINRLPTRGLPTGQSESKRECEGTPHSI